MFESDSVVLKNKYGMSTMEALANFAYISDDSNDSAEIYKILNKVQIHKLILNIVNCIYFFPQVTSNIDNRKHVQKVIKNDIRVKVTIFNYFEYYNFYDKLW